MPEGVDVTVVDGFASIEFVDSEKRGPGLKKLLEHTPAELIEKRTRPRVTYTVPEGNAREAGLLDDGADVDTADDGKGYDDGKPDMDWSRKAIDDYAAELTPPLDTTGEANKHDALDAIKAHIEEHPQTP